MNLKMPQYDEVELPARWENLIANLFPFMVEKIAKGEALEHLDQDLNSWKETIENVITENPKSEVKMQWDIVRCMIWSAQKAVEPDFDLATNLIERAIVSLKNKPSYVERHEGWVLSCIHTLRYPEHQWYSLKVPVAFCNIEKKAFLAELKLEVLSPGAREIFHHPEDILKSYLQEEFKESILRAWESALKVTKKTGVDARWRLIIPGNQNLRTLDGPSASGAAALGWYHALMGTKPDDGVIVLAEIDQEGNLSEVGGIEAKTKAIAAANERGDTRFDTIVVASENNFVEAGEALGFDKKSIEKLSIEDEFNGVKRKILPNKLRVWLSL